jgi:ATP-dependent protease ClpP protease subunit
MSDESQLPERPIYARFHDEINEQSVARVVARLAEWGEATDNPHVHITFYSWGGKVEAGFDLHEVFSNSPLKLTLYTHCALSIAVVAFLGAKNRKAAPNSSFKLYPVLTKIPGEARIEELRNAVRKATSDNNRLNTFFDNHLNLTPSQRRLARKSILPLDERQAAKCGLIGSESDIASFSLPAGARMNTLSVAPFTKSEIGEGHEI